jgi:hypothetical protein
LTRRKDADLQTLLVDERLRVELEPLSVEQIRSLWKNAVDRGDDEKARSIEYASLPQLLRLARGDIEQMQKQRDPLRFRGAGEPSKEQGQAVGLLADFDRARQSRIPEAIGVSAGIYLGLLQLFRAICGHDARRMSRQDYEAQYLRGHALDEPLGIDPRWHVRALPDYLPLGPREGDGYRRRRADDDRGIAPLLRLSAAERESGAVARLAQKGR